MANETPSPQRLAMTRPDDWHVHLRDGAMLSLTVRDTARRFARAIVMPNLDPPVVTTAQALHYRQRILDALPAGLRFDPLMTLYLTDQTPATEMAAAKASGRVHGVKWYPAGATTNSARGVTDIRRCEAVLAAMEDQDLPLLVHGEVTDPAVDVFDREQVFIERELAPLLERHPQLRVVLEHITTRQAVDFVTQAPPRVAATITVHHLLLNRNALFTGGLRPHHYCLPVLKREEHRRALLRAATGGNPKFFLGTDSAPHARRDKESACGCAGIYTAHAAIELYAEVFAAEAALDRLQAFACFHGADFYGLPRNTESLTLERKPWAVSPQIGEGEDALIPLRAGESVAWRIASELEPSPIGHEDCVA
ncbi:MAG: dihydroorotase [Stagnimonas sp.]|nr:dihydroorotase [Stagnimonas sp.]